LEVSMVNEQDTFVVKGEPKVTIEAGRDSGYGNLKMVLEQKVEELREKERLEHRIVSSCPGAEFKPENTPFIPDSNHPILNVHTLATAERNAGFQDMSQVPRELARTIIEHRDKMKAEAEDAVTIEVETNKGVSTATVSGGDKGYPQSCPQGVNSVNTVNNNEPKPKEPDFKIGVSREKMHSGGHYMPNESRPFRPGD
jgi:hypothetical protein